ncbi:hypothetical protein A3J36_01510 [Candidatus Uhrbacteria bacterium RIFCSPLOWO2_02_FULL_54_37]|uniref:Uncharacterized protein n=1 Tax=Candidatus Uhrbacteria bacterium RIFCSPLOWO2_02_FULL_54_37 TaxID=1802412 RepID=A0A1F7VHD8_9BACT|nr:MAG: hypothetical protein A3J36_01510 [Candidatus Uhrbacteria bacterium RIFCSPLOWO2_02_FULL_54_37]
MEMKIEKRETAMAQSRVKGVIRDALYAVCGLEYDKIPKGMELWAVVEIFFVNAYQRMGRLGEQPKVNLYIENSEKCSCGRSGDLA